MESTRVLSIAICAAAVFIAAAGPAECRPDGNGPAGPSPKVALLRSAIYPGWGQLSNRKPYKACVIMAVEVYLAGVAFTSDRKAGDAAELAGAAETAAEAARFQELQARYEDRRNAHFWWLGAAILYSMLDAYVDAHLAGASQEASKPPPVLIETGLDASCGFGFALIARF